MREAKQVAWRSKIPHFFHCIKNTVLNIRLLGIYLHAGSLGRCEGVGIGYLRAVFKASGVCWAVMLADEGKRENSRASSCSQHFLPRSLRVQSQLFWEGRGDSVAQGQFLICYRLCCTAQNVGCVPFSVSLLLPQGGSGVSVSGGRERKECVLCFHIFLGSGRQKNVSAMQSSPSSIISLCFSVPI